MRADARILALAAIFLLVGAVAAYAWDASRAERIADGVTVSGVEIGGLEPDAAERLLHAELVEPLARPIRVNADGRTFRLSARELKVRAPIESIVAEAQAVSREDALPSRVWRYITGGEVDRAITARVSFSKQALDAFVARIEDEVNHAAHEATIAPASGSLRVVPARAGAALRSEQLRDRIAAAVTDPGRPATIKAAIEPVAPEVRAKDLRASNPTYITVDRKTFKLRLFEDLKLAKTYTIAVGQQGYDTPAGLYAIESKQVNPTWYVPEAEWASKLAGEVVPPGPDNPLKARWMGFLGGAGIHGTDDIASLGGAASHGCVRMAIPDVIELYKRVDVGTPVYIE